jgi:site-specific DNA recombinase
MTMTQKRKVIGLVRVSTEGQAKDDRGGLPRQMEVIEQTIRAQDLECLEIIKLKGVSGTEVRGNREIQRVLKMIESREIAGVVVADLDRLMRPAQGQDYALLDPFIDSKAIIFANGQQFDFASPTSNLMVKLLLGFAEFERSLIVNRSRGAVREMCRRGQHPFGQRQLPRGVTYDRRTNTWGTDDKITPVVEAFRLMDDGVTNIAEVARRVGVHERAMHNLLRNPLYSGWRYYSTGRSTKKVVSKHGKAYKKKVPLPPEEVIRVQVLNPPPVSLERFGRVQTILADSNKAWKAERDDRPAYNLLRSVARCGRCDCRLYFSQDRRRPSIMGYYFCSQHYYRKGKKGTCGAINMSKADLDQATLGFITEILTKPKILKAMMMHSRAIMEANQAQPELEKVDPAAFEHRKKRLKDGYEGGVISMVELRERLAQIQHEEEATRRVAVSQAKSLAGPEIDELIRLVVNGAHAFQKLVDPDWRLRVIKRLFSAIYFEAGQITKFKLQPALIRGSVCEVNLNQGLGSWPRRA